ncbi:hypothetical protein ACOSP7_023595 [Xanthoceras sorbifolium]|uniref:Smr domain-containing protein n=1 Tax=Xanthoceras sorbifolium TaxID=99658 RepID=A0ABQ8HRJ3_9ROSI|nr:hypothetical protein JRO89_XS08G0249800 [Xanthoceras sorbifolium]
MKPSQTRGKSPGWAAFALKQQKQSPEAEVVKDPYPPIPSTLTSLRNCEYIRRNTDLSVRPFSSVLPLSVDYQTSTWNKNSQNPIPLGNSNYRGKNGNTVIEENNHDSALKKLKLLHSWADNSLIEDIMSAVDNSIEKASTILEGMVSSSSSGEKKETKIADLSSTVGYFPCDKKVDNRFLLKKTLDPAAEDSAKGTYRELTDVNASYGIKLTELASVNASFGKKLSDNAADMKSILEHLCSIPIEPEWEEDDLYLSLRKDALKMMRSASQNSKAANNAFLRGDHFAAHQHSLKAREEWLIADRLNSKAAKEILSIRNSENDMWKLDLHGLHATEAVQALQERLQKIEMRGPINRSVSPSKGKAMKGMVHTSSLESFSCVDREDVDKQCTSFKQIRTPLQVITGIGKHSRGQASLPTAVRSFLGEHGYRFEEARPGVISVRPKIRHK